MCSVRGNKLLDYLDETDVLDVRVDEVPPADRNRATGYGGKIPTAYSVRMLSGDNRARWHRVYCMVYGNGAVPYVIVGGRNLMASRALHAHWS